MNYDFTTMMDRRGKDSEAFDIPEKTEKSKIKPGFDMIPMWVADMNFATAPSVTRALMERISHPLYGYFSISDRYYDAIIEWQKRQNQVEGLTKECIGYENGVLGGVISALRVMCSQGDGVLVHSPTYVGFISTLKNNGFDMIDSPLKLDDDGIWRMDYEDMEKKIKLNHIHAAIFCSPHNPCGRVWEKWEILKAMEVYERNCVYVISDEIWSDIIMKDHVHIPVQMVNDYARSHTVALYAPSKTFNLAGLIGSYHIIYDKWLRDRVKKQSSLTNYNEINVLSMHALIGAYNQEGSEWLDQLKKVLQANIDYSYDFIRQNVDGVEVAKPQGTYMFYLICDKWCEKHEKTIDQLLEAGKSVGVIWQDGRQFNGKCSIRMNLALPYDMLKQALERLDKYVFNV